MYAQKSIIFHSLVQKFCNHLFSLCYFLLHHFSFFALSLSVIQKEERKKEKCKGFEMKKDDLPLLVLCFCLWMVTSMPGVSSAAFNTNNNVYSGKDNVFIQEEEELDVESGFLTPDRRINRESVGLSSSEEQEDRKKYGKVKYSDGDDLDQEANWRDYVECQPGSVVTAFKFSLAELPTNREPSLFPFGGQPLFFPPGFRGPGGQGQSPSPLGSVPAHPFFVPKLAMGLMGVAFQCSKFDFWKRAIADTVIYDGQVNPGTPWIGSPGKSKGQAQAVGFQVDKWTNEDGMRIYGRWRLQFRRAKISVAYPPKTSRRARVDASCPGGQAICGFATLRHPALGFITKIRIRCCFFCFPEEAHTIIYDYTNWAVTDVAHSVMKKIGTYRIHSSTIDGTTENRTSIAPTGAINLDAGSSASSRLEDGILEAVTGHPEAGLSNLGQGIVNYLTLFRPPDPNSLQNPAGNSDSPIAQGQNVIFNSLYSWLGGGRFPGVGRPSSVPPAANLPSSAPATSAIQPTSAASQASGGAKSTEAPSFQGQGQGQDEGRGIDLSTVDQGKLDPSPVTSLAHPIFLLFIPPLNSSFGALENPQREMTSDVAASFSFDVHDETSFASNRSGRPRGHDLPSQLPAMTLSIPLSSAIPGGHPLPPLPLIKLVNRPGDDGNDQASVKTAALPLKVNEKGQWVKQEENGRRARQGQPDDGNTDTPSNGSPGNGQPSQEGESRPPSPQPGGSGSSGPMVILPPEGIANQNRPSRPSGGAGEDDADAPNLTGGRPGSGGGGRKSRGGRGQAESIKGMFGNTFTRSRSDTFNWKDNQWEQLIEERTETDTFNCKALHRCVIKQLVGKCGNFQFNTPSFSFFSIPLTMDPLGIVQSVNPFYPGNNINPLRRPASSLSSLSFLRPLRPTLRPPTPMPMKIERPGEVWMVAENLTFAPRSYSWDNPQSCPAGSVCTGYAIKSRLGQPLTGISLLCSKINASEKFEPVVSLTCGAGSSKSWYNASSEAVGVTFIQYTSPDGTSVKQNFELRFAGESMDLPVPRGASNMVRSQVTCPPNNAICGMQPMFDVNQGEMTDLGIKCCYHCQPQEKMVTLESFTNLGYTDTVQTIRRTVGRDHINGQMAEGVNSTGFANNVDGINPSGLQAGFAAKFDNSNFDAFNWGQTSNSFWTTHEEKTMTLVCKARHLCTFKQLVGVCGKVEIPTPYTVKESVWLDDPNRSGVNNDPRIALQRSSEPGINDREIQNGRGKRNGETWIVAENVTFTMASGVWDQPQICPFGTVVTAEQWIKDHLGHLTGLTLACCGLVGAEKFRFAASLRAPEGEGDGRMGEGRGRQGSYFSSTPAVGFTHLEYSINGTKMRSGWEMIFENQTFFHPTPQGGVNVTRKRVDCPLHTFVCGVQTMFDGQNSGHVTHIAFKCCLFCFPREKMVALQSFTNFGMTSIQQNVGVNIGAGQQQQQIQKAAMSLLGVPNDQSQGQLKTFPPFNPQGKGQGQSILDIDFGYFGSDPSQLSLLLQQLFTTRFRDQTCDHCFNWQETPMTFWTGQEVKQVPFLCRPRHSCKMKQVMGVCGPIEIPTGKMHLESHPLDKMDKGQKSDPRVTLPIEMRKPGEIWILAQNVTSWRSSGIWELPKNCPKNSFVTSSQFRRTKRRRLLSINLGCSYVSEDGHFYHVADLLSNRTVTAMTRDLNKNSDEWYNSTSEAVGFSFIDYTKNGRTWKGLWEVRFSGDQTYYQVPDGALKVVRHEVTCPKEHAICGVAEMLDSDQRGFLSSLGFKCCFFCTPTEKIIVLDSFQNFGWSDTVRTVEFFVGADVPETLNEDGTHLQSIFSAIGPGHPGQNSKERSPNFDWSQTPASLFTKKVKKKVSVLCKARHVCEYRQLIGICAGYEIHTPFTISQSAKIRSDSLEDSDQKNPDSSFQTNCHSTPKRSIEECMTNKSKTKETPKFGGHHKKTPDKTKRSQMPSKIGGQEESKKNLVWSQNSPSSPPSRAPFCSTPAEKMVVLDSFTNYDHTESLQTVDWTVGWSGTEPEPPHNFADLKLTFGHILGQSKIHPGFNWTDTSLSLWTRTVDKKTEYKCAARSVCTFRQLVGVCRDNENVQISTPITSKQSVPLDL